MISKYAKQNTIKTSSTSSSMESRECPNHPKLFVMKIKGVVKKFTITTIVQNEGQYVANRKNHSGIPEL